MLLSLVRSGGGDVGEILRDARRLNVACSRAKHKIVLIGSAETLTRGSPALARVIALARARGWLRKLLPAADKCYPPELFACAGEGAPATVESARNVAEVPRAPPRDTHPLVHDAYLEHAPVARSAD